MADSFNDTPAEGDGFTYEHFSSKQVRPWLQEAPRHCKCLPVQ
jgi:hypothetical protein